MPKNLRDLRIEKGEFQRGVADAIGSTTASVSAWETGRVSPEPPMFPKLAEFFGVSVEDIRLAVEQSQREAAELKALAAK